MTPTKPGDIAPIRCSKCKKEHRPRAPRYGAWESVSCCGVDTVLYWTKRSKQLRCDGGCSPAVGGV